MSARGARLAAALGGFLAALVLCCAQPALARSDHGETVVLHSVYIGPGETIDGDVNVVLGDAQVAGVVTGDCNAIFGSCTTVDGGQILGQEHSVTNDAARAFVPWIVGQESGMRAMQEQDRRLVLKLVTSAVVVLVFLLFPLRMRVALDRVEQHPGLSAATGALACVAFVPIAIMLLLSIVGIPLIALEVAALFAGVWIGTGAVALLVGRRLAELVMPHATPSPLIALLLGLVVVCAAQIVPIVGWIVTALVWLIGLGATILSFIRSTQLGPAARAPIGGPPMNGWR